MGKLFEELKRRNVFRVGAAYAIVAWVMVQIGEAVFPAFDVPDALFRGMVILLLLGFPAALVFAWAFERTPEGIKLERNVDRSQSITRETGRKLDRMIIAALGAAVLILLGDRLIMTRDQEATNPSGDRVAAQRSEVGTRREPSIAVLPFVNMSDDPANEYFSDGISEELLNVLVKVSGIKVASRTSSFAFKGKDLSIPEIARQLKVDHVLEGSVRKAGNRVRVTAQLIEVQNDRHLWSETYDRELADIFAIQDEISGHIVEALKVALGSGERQALAQAGGGTANLEAYELYLQGRFLWQRRGEANILKAIDLFTEATLLDPAFARAWSSLAAAYITLPTYAENDPGPLVLDKARSAARRALELDTTLAEAHAVMGDLVRFHHRWAESEAHYRAGIAQEPRNVTVRLWYGEFLLEVGRLQEAVREFELAHELDPLSPGTNINLAGAYLSLGRDEEVLPLARRGTELGHPWGMVQEGVVMLRRGDYAGAIGMFDSWARVVKQPASPYGIAAAALRDGNTSEAAHELARLPAEVRPNLVWRALMMIGEVDAAYTLMDQRFADIEGNDWWSLWNLESRAFRADPRFADLVERLGMPGYWRESGWPDLCEEEDGKLACR